MSGSAGLHPELTRIRREYQELYDSVQGGRVSEEEARELLKNITAVDGDGAIWSFDPYTGEFTRAMPGLPPQPASSQMFAPSRLPDAGGPALGGNDLPPMPSVSPGFGDEGFLDEREVTSGPSRRGIPRLPASTRPFLRPLVVGIVILSAAAVLLSSRTDSQEGAALPDITEPAPEQDMLLELPVAPEHPEATFSPPPVLFDDSGAIRPLSQQDAQRILEGMQNGSTEVFYMISDKWVSAYSLPILGASAAGWDVSAPEWVIDTSGRDRLTIALSSPSFPDVLRWWAFVEPQGGFWRVSELIPLPVQ